MAVLFKSSQNYKGDFQVGIGSNAFVLTTAQCVLMWISQGGARSLIEGPYSHFRQISMFLNYPLTIKYQYKK